MCMCRGGRGRGKGLWGGGREVDRSTGRLMPPSLQSGSRFIRLSHAFHLAVSRRQAARRRGDLQTVRLHGTHRPGWQFEQRYVDNEPNNAYKHEHLLGMEGRRGDRVWPGPGGQSVLCVGLLRKEGPSRTIQTQCRPALSGRCWPK